MIGVGRNKKEKKGQDQLTRGDILSINVRQHIKQLQKFMQWAFMDPQEQVRFGNIVQFWQKTADDNAGTGTIANEDDNLIDNSDSLKTKRIKKGSKGPTKKKSEKSINDKKAATWIFNQIIELDVQVKQIWKKYHNCDYHIKINGEKREGESCGKAQLVQTVLILKDLYQKQKCIQTIQKVQKNLKEVNQNISEKITIFLEEIRRYFKSQYTVTMFFNAIYYDSPAENNHTQPGANKTLKKLTSLPLSNESVKKQLEEAWLKIEDKQKKNQKQYQRRKDKKREEAIAKQNEIHQNQRAGI